MSQREYKAFHNLYSLPNDKHGWRETRNAYKKHLAERVVVGKIIL